MKIKVYENLSKELKLEWEKLWNNSQYATFTNSPQWFIAADKTYKYSNKKIISIYSNENELVAIGGLVNEKIAGISAWTEPAREFAGNECLLIDYSDRKIVDLFLSELLKLSVVFLTNYTVLTLLYLQVNPGVHLYKADTNLIVDFSIGIHGNLPEQKLRRIKNKLQKNGLAWTMNPNEEHKKEALQTIYKIEMESSKLKKGKSVFDEKNSREFYNNLLSYASKELVMSLLYFDNKPIAYSICFYNKRVLQGSQKAHIFTYDTYSPGKLLVAGLLEYAYQKGDGYFDCGRGSDEFKKAFATRSENLYSVVITKNNFVKYYLTYYFIFRECIYWQISQHKKMYKLFKMIKKGK